MQLEASARYEVLMRAESNGALIMPMTLSRLSNWQGQSSREQMLQGVLIGIALMLLAYSLIQWVILREAQFLSYGVLVFGSLLSDEECDALIAAARPRMARSLTVATKTGGEELNADRTSNGMFFQRGENEIVKRLEERIAKLVNWPVENGEGLQILQYGPGAEYKPHYDYFDPNEPGTSTILKRGGQRVATLVMYLGEPDKGGGTTFPDVHLEVAPKRGNAVFFSYERAHPSTKTLHGGAPVIAGEKWIATKWLREREFQ